MGVYLSLALGHEVEEYIHVLFPTCCKRWLTSRDGDRGLLINYSLEVFLFPQDEKAPLAFSLQCIIYNFFLILLVFLFNALFIHTTLIVCAG